MLLVAIVAASMVTLAGRSMDRALVCRRARQDLQRRWAMRSSRVALLNQAEHILQVAEAGQLEPIAQVRVQLQLNDHAYSLLISDEQAKVNANAVYRLRGKQRLEKTIRELTRRTDSALTVRLRPIVNFAHHNQKELSPFQSFGQLFAAASPQQLPKATSGTTCWGDGRLNVRRASPKSLEQVCVPLLGPVQIQQLVAILSESPAMSLSAALEQLQISRSTQHKLLKRLTDRSNCHSLWISIDDGDRSWHQFAVKVQSKRGPGHIRILQW